MSIKLRAMSKVTAPVEVYFFISRKDAKDRKVLIGGLPKSVDNWHKKTRFFIKNGIIIVLILFR